MKLPKIRENLLVQELKDEVLLYDQTTSKSYCLNETAKIVFDACDGKKDFSNLNLPADIIYLSLDELKKHNLIQSDYVSPFGGMNRREVIKRVGLASMIALPVISSLVAPSAVQAASGCVNPSGAAAGQPAGAFGCSSNTTAQCAALCNNNATVRNTCCSGNATATAGGSCGLTNCCVCA